MAITEAFTGSEAVSSTNEWSLTTDTAGPDAETSDGIFQVFLDLSALANGDIFQFKGYEKIAAGTQRAFLDYTFAHLQSTPHFVSDSFILMDGWDFTLKKIAGTDRTIIWSIRKIA